MKIYSREERKNKTNVFGSHIPSEEYTAYNKKGYTKFCRMHSSNHTLLVFKLFVTVYNTATNSPLGMN